MAMHFSKRLPHDVRKAGIRFVSALMVTSILLSNFTAVAQARQTITQAPQTVTQENPSVTRNVHAHPSFIQSESIIGGHPGNNKDFSSSNSESETINSKSFIAPLFQTPSCVTSGDLEVTNGQTCSLAAGSYTYDGVTIQTGGTLILLGNTTLNQGVTIITPIFTIAGTVQANGQGYSAVSGPGRGASGSNGSGAGYGGLGGISSIGQTGGAAYGSVYEPVELGSGGGNNGGTIGGAGGGAIRLIVSGALQLSGTISANGNNGSNSANTASGGGSGGSIWITADSLSGNGFIRTNGGVGGSSPFGGAAGGGAGGRIAIDVAVNTFTGAATSFGGSGSQIAGAGTIYWETTDKLVIDNNSQAGRNAILLSGVYDFDTIDIRRQGTLRILSSTSSLTMNNNTITGDGTGRLEVEGTVHAPSDFMISGAMLAILNGFDGPTNITTQTNGGLELYASAIPVGIYDYDNINVGLNTTLRLVPYNNGDTNFTNDYGVTLQVDNLTVATGGVVTASGQGYAAAAGPGKGANAVNQDGGGGAGHGGIGGTGSGTAAGVAYGDVYSPIALGSGGGNNGGLLGGAGAGAFRLIVSGTMQVNGTISANGLNGGTTANTASGGGSGGSIWISAGTLTGNGAIQANGGSGPQSSFGGRGGGGAGGRIAIDVPTAGNTYTGVVTTFGGAGFQTAGAGTIYWITIDKLAVNNNHSQTSSQTILPAGTYDFSNIDVQKTGILRVLGSTSSLTITNSTFSGDGTGRVEVEGTVHAPSVFMMSATMLTILNGLDGPVSITTQTNGGLELHAAGAPSGIYSFTTLSVGSGTTLRLVPYNNGDTDYLNDYGVTLQVDNLTVATGGVLTASGRGYGASAGPGKGANAVNQNGGGGAGHGGIGGTGNGTAAGVAYGDVYSPIALGSGGGNNGGLLGGAGAGAIRLIVSGTMQINGTISANGLNGGTTANTASGGGSGGSIWISAGTLAGNGAVQANGGSGPQSSFGGRGGGGAGGRIAVYSDNRTGTIIYSAAGGAGNQTGGVGSIFFGGIDPTLSTVQVNPLSLIADGTTSTILTVTLKNVDGIPIPNQPIEIAIVAGSVLFVNTQQVGLGVYIPIGTTNASGIVTATLKATKSGIRMIQARSDQVLIGQQGTVEFVPGPVSALQSLMTASPTSAPADGQSPITVTVTARDSNNNLIQGADVVLQSTGNAVITQPTTPTDSQGKTSGQIVNASGETVAISAKVNGVDLQDTVNIVFRAADMQLLLTAPSVQSVGTNIQYQVDVRNISSIAVQNASLQVDLPAGIAYINSNASVGPSENGQTLTWSLGNFAPGASTVFTIFGSLASSVPAGTVLEIHGVLTSATPEESLTNNSATANTQVVDGRSFTVSLAPISKTIGANATAMYQISIDNTGLLADNYNLTVSGLDPSWFALSETAFNLAPGEVKIIDLSLQASGCTLTGSMPFSVNTISSNQTITKSAQLIAQPGPVVTNIYPENNTSLGSRDVTFSWKSDSLSTGTLHIFPVGQPAQDVPYSTPSSTSHSRTVTGLTRNVTYAWFVEAASECGVTTTPTRQFTVSNGVVFKSHDQSYTINRDYDQTIMIPVINQDTVSHTIHLEIVPHPYADLTVNFRGSGSIDQDITLLPGETRSVQLAFFAQDAQLNNYVITARLTSEDGGETISDLATIRTRVLFEANYTIEAVHVDPALNVTTYRVKNSDFGQPITDLTISAMDHSTGLPANVLLVPQIYHARLGTGESLEFQAIPQYSVDQVANFNNLGAPSGVLAAPKKYRVSTVSFDLVSRVKDLVQVLPVQQQCDGNVYAVTFDGPRAIALPFYTWYCPNRPNILIELMLSLFMGNSEILDSLLQLSFSPAAMAEAHDMTVSINGHEVGGTTNAVPDGTYSFNIDRSFINPSSNSGAKQQININANFDNFAHYQIGSNGKLFIAMDGLTLFICADSLEEAQDIAQQLYGFTKPPEYVNVLIEQPATIGTVTLDENGLVNIRAQVMDDLVPYVNLYSVMAEVEYLDQPGTPSEQFLIFDDGETGHGDAAANDRHFNAKWLPKYGGEVRLTVSAIALGGLSAEASKTFYINAQPDFEVNNVFIEKIAREGDAVEVQAEVANNGFTVTGPVLVEFRYYNATDEGLKIGNPIYTSQQELFGTILNNTFDHGESLTIKDNTFVAPAVHLYYVEVVIDPQTQP